MERQTGSTVELRTQEFLDAFGGDIPERPVLEQVREFVKANKPRYFICLDPDRFSRDLQLQLVVTDEIEKAGTDLVFVQHNYEKTPEGIMFYQMRGVISQFEKAKILERTARGKKGKMKAGGRPNGAVPYGYVQDKVTDQLLVYEPEAQWVRTIFAWAAEERLGPAVIAKRLTELGVPTKRSANKWYRAVVRNMLLNTTYIGKMRCNRIDFRGLGSIRRLPKERRRPLTAAIRPAEEWILVPVPPIIDQETFDKVQSNFKQTTRKGKRQPPGLLSLLVKCGVCGRGMYYSRHSGRQGTRSYFQCKGRYPHTDSRPGTPACSNRHHNTIPVEQGVWEQLVRWLTSPDLLAERLANQAKAEELSLQIGRLEERNKAFREQLATKQREQVLIIQRQAQGLLTSDLADELLTAVQSQVQQIQTSIASVQREFTVLTKKAESLQQTVASSGDVAAAMAEKGQEILHKLSSLSREQRRELVLRLVQSVTLYADGSWTVTPY